MTTSPQSSIDIWTELTRHAATNHIPLTVHIDLTYRCDLACIHCYLEERVKHELTTAELIDTLDQLRDMGTMMVLFSGGDIFLRPDALDILRAACERRFFVHMITHAGHIDETVADALAHMGVGQVRVSIYSSRPEIHDTITRLPGSLHRSLRAIHLLRERQVAVEMKCPVFDQNPGAQLEIPILAAKYDCSYTLDHQIRAAQGSQAGNLPPQGLGGACHDLRSLNLDLDTKADVVLTKYPYARVLADLPTKRSDAPTCSAGRAAMYIDPEGQVFPCLEWEEPCGDLRQRSITEIWNNADVFKRARTMTRSSFSGCVSCENFGFCNICPGQAYRETGVATGVSPTTCRDTTATRIAFERAEAAHDLAQS
ncbi:MAG: radical SAM protein [Myxococcota bacterium]